MNKQFPKTVEHYDTFFNFEEVIKDEDLDLYYALYVSDCGTIYGMYSGLVKKIVLTGNDVNEVTDLEKLNGLV